MATDRGAARARWAVAGMFLVNGFAMGSWAPQIPLLLPRHQITPFVLGLLILLLGLGAVGAMLLAPRALARLGAVRLSVVCGLALWPALVGVVLAPALWAVAPLILAYGGLAGTMDVAMNAHAVVVERRLGRAIMSSSHGFWSVGGFVGGALGGALIGPLGAGGAVLLAAVLGMAVVLAVRKPLQIDATGAMGAAQATGPGTPPAAPQTRPGGHALRKPLVLLLGGMALLSMVPEGAVLDWGALYLSREMGVGPATAGLAFGAFSAAMAVMRFLGDAVRNRFGGVACLRLSALMAALGLLAAAAAPNAGLAILAFGVAGLGVANLVPILFSAAGNLGGLAPGAGIAAVTMMGYSGILIAPSVIGFVAEHLGFRLTYAVLGVLLVLVAVQAGHAKGADGSGVDGSGVANP